MDNSEKRIHTLAVLVDNEAGVLSQVSRMFTRKGYNIESLAVGVTHDSTISRITGIVLNALKIPPAPFVSCPNIP